MKLDQWDRRRLIFLLIWLGIGRFNDAGDCGYEMMEKMLETEKRNE